MYKLVVKSTSNYFWRTYHINKLRKFEFDSDWKNVCCVDDWPDQFVVVGQEVVVEPLGVGVSGVEHDPGADLTATAPAAAPAKQDGKQDHRLEWTHHARQLHDGFTVVEDLPGCAGQQKWSGGRRRWRRRLQCEEPDAAARGSAKTTSFFNND